MYSNILLVGGGLLFEGIESLLQYRIWLHLPLQFRQSANVVVLTRSKVCRDQFLVESYLYVMVCDVSQAQIARVASHLILHMMKFRIVTWTC